ncbi:MAG: hypothetical protein VCC01_11000 [Candidatus Hydrogenedentota bacterium]
MQVRRNNVGHIALLFAVAQLLLIGVHASCNDLAVYNDEFDNSDTLSNWSHINVTESWNADQLEILSIDTTTPGRMTVMPYTCTWYEDYRGPLIYKNITGDVVVTTSMQVTGRDGSSIPQSQYSLSGLMFRTPRVITPGTWISGGENYVFFSIGHGDNRGSSYQFERKTTTNGTSNLILSPSLGNSALLQIARLGNYIILLRRESGQP